MTYLFDTHCHLDLYPDYAALINEIEQEQIYTIAVTNAPSVFRQCATLTRKCKYIRAALGLHPELVMQRFRELDMMIEMLSETRYIGEVGLDYVTRNHGERELQRKVFQCIIEKCAGQGGKIVTVHSRRAADDVIDIIGDTFPGVILLHWFTGTDRALARALACVRYDL